MHEWHTETSRNPLHLINEFIGFEFNTDYGGNQRVLDVIITNRAFSSEDEATSFVTRSSYGGQTAYMAVCVPNKQSKAYQSAYTSFITKYKEYAKFKTDLTVGYGRKSIRVSCPNCDSSITLKYGGKFKSCPVCGSKKIISDSNWKILETRRKMAEKAAENLAREAEKSNVTFVCGIEWHC